MISRLLNVFVYYLRTSFLIMHRSQVAVGEERLLRSFLVAGSQVSGGCTSLHGAGRVGLSYYVLDCHHVHDSGRSSLL